MDPTVIDWSARPAEFISAILPDIIFKFTDGEVAAHKTVLVMVSRVFRDMLIDHNTLDMEAKEIAIEDCRKQPFQIMIDAINNAKLVKESLRGKSMEEMFAVLYVVTKYEIHELKLAVKECVSNFPITEDNVLEVATTAMEFLDTFEEPARNVFVSCAKFLERRFTDVESFNRDVAENGDRIATVHKLAEVIEGLKMAKSPDFLIATEKTNGKSDPAKEELLEKDSSNEDTDEVAENDHIKNIEKESENEAEETKEEEDGDVATEKTNGKSDPAEEKLLEKDSSNEDTDEVAERDHIEKESENEAEETKKEDDGDVATEKTNGKSDPAKEELLAKESSNEDTDEVAEDDHIKKESENEVEETKEEEDGDVATEKTNGKSDPAEEELLAKESSNEDTDEVAEDDHFKKESENEAEETKEEEDGDAANEDGEVIDEVESDRVLPLSEEADTKTKPDIGDDYDESKERKSDENEEPEKSSENQKPQTEPKKMKANEKAKNDIKCYKCGDVGHYAKECLIEGADKCFNCKEEGHKSKQCKKPKPCHNCQKHGHHSRECPEPKKPKNLKRAARDGDDEATAPKRKKNSKEEKRKCFKGGKAGNSYTDCMERVCHNCRGVGHKKIDCSKPKKVGCFKCGQEGHMAYRCKSEKTEEISME